MNISTILTSSLDRVKSAEEKTPLICMAVRLLYCAWAILYNLVFAIFGYVSFFGGILSFLSVLSTIAGVVLAAYLVLLYVKGKNLVHLLAGIAYLLGLFASGILGLLLAAAGNVCILWMSFRSEEEEVARTGKFSLCVVGVQIVVIIISMLLVWRMPRFLYGIWSMIHNAVAAVMVFLLLAAILYDAKQIGGVKSVVVALIAKIKKEEVKTPAVSPVEEKVEEAPVAEVAEQESVVVEPVVAEPVISAAVSTVSHAVATPGSGEYRYKTVAGPVGLTVSKDASYADGVSQYAAIIQREAVDGWVFDSVYEIPVSKQAGCLATLMGQGTTTVRFNMLIFRKEV